MHMVGIQIKVNFVSHTCAKIVLVGDIANLAIAMPTIELWQIMREIISPNHQKQS